MDRSIIIRAFGIAGLAGSVLVGSGCNQSIAVPQDSGNPDSGNPDSGLETDSGTTMDAGPSTDGGTRTDGHSRCGVRRGFLPGIFQGIGALGGTVTRSVEDELLPP